MNKKKIILISIVVLLGIFVLISLIPFLYTVFSMLWSIFFEYPAKPINKHGEFPFELVYEYKDEEKTITDTIICDYKGTSYAVETGNFNDWDCKFLNNDDNGYYYIDKENEPDLYIVVPTAPSYFMGEKNDSIEEAEPYIYYIDENSGTHYYEKESIDIINIKIIEWLPSEPLKLNFK